MKTNQPKPIRRSMLDVECWMLNVGLALFLFSYATASAAIRYVDLNSASPTPPFTNWATGATNIQDAILYAEPGDEIVVTNGIYRTGGMPPWGSSPGVRVACNQNVAIRSVNGPQFTFIEGWQVPGTTNGIGAIRCVYLANGASLSGFTLTNGATTTSPWDYDASGGGVYCAGTTEVVSNCVIVANSAARYGGGAHQGTLKNCILVGNTANEGGGAYGSVLECCTLTGNDAQSNGGGAAAATLRSCSVNGNSAFTGGGVISCTMTNCTLIGNSARSYGGGANGGTLNNCIVYFNKARLADDNHNSSTLNYSCTTPLPAYGDGNISDEPQLASASHLSANSPCVGRGSAAYASGLDVDREPWGTPPSIGCDEYWSGSVTGALNVAIGAAYADVAAGWQLEFQVLIEGRVSHSRWDFGDGTVISNRPFATHSWAQAGDYEVELRAYNESYPNGVAATLPVHVSAPPVHYVALDSPNPTSPFNTWATAATNIQDAVDAVTVVGAMVLVSNGVYQTGARAIHGMSNRVAVTMPVEVRSVNGPEVTHIVGYQVPEIVNGPSAIRCVYLTDRAMLTGFTLTNGATRTGDYGSQQWSAGGGVWCEWATAVVSNCVVVSNSAGTYGGGAYVGTLYNCGLQGNSAGLGGGGASDSVLNSCVLTGNSASGGGGVYGGTLDNCRVMDNTASSGGGVLYASLNNCFLTGNSAEYGGGACNSTLNNCTLTGNLATSSGGGIYDSTLNNCIVYFNSALVSGDNHSGYDGFPSRFNYSCTVPWPGAGGGNITNAPQLASASHLSANSPCRGAGNAMYAVGHDLDGELWANPPSMGCDEVWTGSVTGALSTAMLVSYTNVAVGFSVEFQALIEGRVSDSRWDFGDGTVVSNQPYASHTWTEAGDYLVELRAYNESYPAGVATSVTVHVQVQPVHHVAVGSPSPTPPYNSWATAATHIQDAVDAATLPGALVLVTNGVYQTGARAVNGISNRVAVTKPLTLRSVNGPGVTHVVGYQEPGITNGPAAVRCVYLTNRAELIGFTLTNGAAQSSGGGILCESASAVVSNCVIVGNAASGNGAGVSKGTLYNCAIQGNSGGSGGGAYLASINDCTLTGNSAYRGGGAYNCALNRCTLTGNSSSYQGGGADACTLNNCTLSTNSAFEIGGGAVGGNLDNCLLIGNSARYGGGVGADISSGTPSPYLVRNCVLRGNVAQVGAGSWFGTLINCTLTGNSASGDSYGNYGGGSSRSTLTNCIVYYNTPNNVSDSFTSHCCTTPLPIGGMGNLSAEPQFAGNWHLAASSPCRGAGSATDASGLDLDGEPWANPPSIGCDEFWTGSVTGALSVALTAAYTNATVGIALNFQGIIEGRVSASSWDFGDGTVISNIPFASHAWTTVGDYLVTLRAYNESYPSGVATSITIRVVADSVHYVALTNSTPLAPYTSWANAANNIQDAVNAAIPGGTVLVHDGVYQAGGAPVGGVSNRVAVIKPLTLRSVNGPAVTSIVGNHSPSVRCVYLTNGTQISGFTLTNGSAGFGGGVFCQDNTAVVSNCVLIGNSASEGGGAANGTLRNCILSGNSGRQGGGAASARLINCLLVGNTAPGSFSLGGLGGGAYASRLTNCTIVANSALYHGSGAYACQMANSILYYNTANLSSGDSHLSGLTYCWTKGIGGSPLFVNTNGWADLRLRSNSPCINAGFNGYVTLENDLAGNLRIAGGTVDMGAYEFQSPASILSYAWAQRFGLPTDGSADYADADTDGHNAWQEWRADTNPTNAASVLRLFAPMGNAAGVTVRWQSVARRNYFLERASNLGAPPAFSLLTSNIVGQTGSTSFTDTNAVGPGPFFYRVGIQQ